MSFFNRTEGIVDGYTYSQYKELDEKYKAANDYAITPSFAKRNVTVEAPIYGDHPERVTVYEQVNQGVLSYDAWQRDNLERVRQEQKGYLDIDQAYDEYLYDKWTESKQMSNSFGIKDKYQTQLSNLITSHRNAWAERNKLAEEHAQQIASRRTEMLMRKAQRAIQTASTGGSSTDDTVTHSNHTDNALVSADGDSSINSTSADAPQGSLY